MTGLLLLALTLLPAAPKPDPSEAQAELQGLYDEISQVTLQFDTASDIDLFHSVLYTPDWSVTDGKGNKQTWTDLRGSAVGALTGPRLDWIMQPIQKVALTADGATVVVNLTTVRTIVDAEGRYGKPGASHTLTETTPYRDAWAKASDTWKMKSREQIGQPTVVVDKPEWSNY